MVRLKPHRVKREGERRGKIMACFLVPATEAVITTVITIATKKKESKESDKTVSISMPDGTVEERKKIKFSTKLGWLNAMLWGGSALLAFEHLWHGEISPFFPFLTAVKTGEVADMLKEMGSAGVTMAVLVTAVWGVMLIISHVLENKAAKEDTAKQEG